MRRITLTMLACLATAAVASDASAAQRYADVAGSGVTCGQGSPCDLREAISNAGTGDEVIVNPGTYTNLLPAIVASNGDLDIHGAAGQPHPLLVSDANGGSGAIFLNTGTSVDRIDFRQDGSGGHPISSNFPAPNGFDLSNSKITAPVFGGRGLALNGPTHLTNVSIDLIGDSGIGIIASSGTALMLQNVTIASPGNGGSALFLSAATDNIIVNADSSILGSSGAGYAIQPVTTVPNVISIVTSNTNINVARIAPDSGTSYFPGPGDQSDPPVFTDAAGGDLSQAPTSPTVDAASVGPDTPSTDVTGKLRPIGPAPDIGAYEYGAAPTVTTGTASSGQPTTATVSGQINTNDSDSTYHFDYGKTTAYGSATGEGSLGQSLTANSVSTSLQGLEPNTTYHYRLVSTNVLGTTVGADATFKTPANPFSGLEIPKQTLKPKKNALKLRVRCPADTTGSCKGTVSTSAKKGKRKLSLKKRSFDVAANTSTTVTFKLSRKQARTLRSARKMSGTASASSTDAAGQSKQTSGKVTLKR